MSGLSGEAVLQQTFFPMESGAIAQGERATAVGGRGVSVGGNVGGSIITGQVQIRPSLPIYFHLCILEAQDAGSEPDFDAPHITRLEPGNRYWVAVWTDVNGSSGQKSVFVQSPLSLTLEVKDKETAAAQAITIANPLAALTENQVDDFEHTFELITATDLPHGQITLDLVYRQGRSRFKRDTAVSQQLDLAGNYNPIDQVLLEACHIDLAMERPSNTAIIRVENAGTAGQVRLTCWGYHANRTLQTNPFTPPNVCLADFIEAQEDPLTVLSKLRAFSSDNPDLELIAWIKLLRQRLGAGMQLVLVDHTDTEIPWEMLELKDGVYLGAIVPVARWLPVPYYDKYVQMQVTTKQRIGRVIAYLDEQELPHTVVERQHLRQFTADFLLDIQGLHDGLTQSLAEIGLVYLACHGMFASDTDKVAYGSWHNPGNRLIPLQLEHLPYHELDRPVLFVNACHSARLKRHGQALHGLPIVMLKRVASGYIGTLGPVGSTYASEIASTILAAIRDTVEGSQPVELLRLLRASAAQRLNADKKSLENQLRFIYTFMYVYYGNPLAQLRLLPAPGDGDE